MKQNQPTTNNKKQRRVSEREGHKTEAEKCSASRKENEEQQQKVSIHHCLAAVCLLSMLLLFRFLLLIRAKSRKIGDGNGLIVLVFSPLAAGKTAAKKTQSRAIRSI